MIRFVQKHFEYLDLLSSRIAPLIVILLLIGSCKARHEAFKPGDYHSFNSKKHLGVLVTPLSTPPPPLPSSNRKFIRAV